MGLKDTIAGIRNRQPTSAALLREHAGSPMGIPASADAPDNLSEREARYRDMIASIQPGDVIPKKCR